MKSCGNRTWRSMLGRGSRSALPLASFLFAVFPYVSGCADSAGSADPTVEIELIPGEVATGILFDGQQLRATTLVEAGHIYHLGARLTEEIPSATGFEEIQGTLSGTALADPVAFLVRLLGTERLGDLQTGTIFIPDLAGEVVGEFRYVPPATSESADQLLEALRRLIRGRLRATYELLLTDLGLDDNGTSPKDAVVLTVGIEGELLGTVTPGDEADFFVLQVEAETTYQLRLEATDFVTLTSGGVDRFGQINFGAPTPGGLVISATASAGNPSGAEFTAPATEQVLLRLTSTVFAGGALDLSTAAAVQYAISVVEVVPDEQ